MKKIKFCCVSLLFLILCSCGTNEPIISLTIEDEITTTSETITFVLQNKSRRTIMTPIYLENIEKFNGTDWIPLNRKGYHRTAFMNVKSLVKGEEKRYIVNLPDDYYGFLEPGNYRLPITCEYKRIIDIGEWLQFQDAWYFCVE